MERIDRVQQRDLDAVCSPKKPSKYWAFSKLPRISVPLLNTQPLLVSFTPCCCGAKIMAVRLIGIRYSETESFEVLLKETDILAEWQASRDKKEDGHQFSACSYRGS